TIIGITESATVAIGIFVFHLVSMGLLLILGGIALFSTGTEVLMENLRTPAPGGIMMALFFGFSAAMLGISGFESSANFVEEQADGVFPKTLRNMWLAVSFFNPAMALMALALVPIGDVEQVGNTLLAHMGQESGGGWLATLISVDAALVLSGAVLTSFIGVNGLVRRMTLDRCLPQFLLKENSRGTTHRILITFFALCVSVLLITRGELKALAGIYTISFLAVMALFALGAILLKVRRKKLPRPTSASWTTVFVGLAAVLTGLVGNAVMNPDYLRVFIEYFIPALLIVTIMLGRITILRLSLAFIRSVIVAINKPLGNMILQIREKIDEINSQQIVFFTRGDNMANLNNVMLYVRSNEHTNRIKIVTVVQDESQVDPHLEPDLKVLDKAYPEIDVEFVVLTGEFNPALIHALSEEWHIPTNLMFIGAPTGALTYSLRELGGVRLII
ncbi:MAG: APC family permease, partial [Planctomycetes bacterium]|nr:APC family permease [Planctomycetota bacterium]